MATRRYQPVFVTPRAARHAERDLVKEKDNYQDQLQEALLQLGRLQLAVSGAMHAHQKLHAEQQGGARDALLMQEVGKRRAAEALTGILNQKVSLITYTP